MVRPWMEAALATAALLATADSVLADATISHSPHLHAENRDSLFPAAGRGDIPARTVALQPAKREEGSSGDGWKSGNCSDPEITDYYHYPSHLWDLVEADDAWSDVVRTWEETDRPNGLSLTASLTQTLHIPPFVYCANLARMGSCRVFLSCGETRPPLYVPAAQEIWNALVNVAEIFPVWQEMSHNQLLFEETSLKSWLTKPLPQERWLPYFADLFTVGSAMAVGSYVRRELSEKSYFLQNETTFHNINDTTLAILGNIPIMAGHYMANPDQFYWNPTKADAFDDYLKSKASDGWNNITASGLQILFNGDDASIKTLWSIISDGQFTPGINDNPVPDVYPPGDLRSNFQKLYHGLFVPAAWRESGSYVFVLDSGVSCKGDAKPLSSYLDDATVNATGACYNDRRYFVVQPKGSSSKGRFSAPQGVGELTGSQFVYGGLTKEHVITGSVITYAANGNKNGGSIDLTDHDTLVELVNLSFTAPGFMKLPVCTPEQALQSWRSGKPKNNPYYPCPAPEPSDGGK